MAPARAAPNTSLAVAGSRTKPVFWLKDSTEGGGDHEGFCRSVSIREISENVGETGLTMMPRLAGRVQGVVVQITNEPPASATGPVVALNFTKMAGEVFSLYSTSASARAVLAP